MQLCQPPLWKDVSICKGSLFFMNFPRQCLRCLCLRNEAIAMLFLYHVKKLPLIRARNLTLPWGNHSSLFLRFSTYHRTAFLLWAPLDASHRATNEVSFTPSNALQETWFEMHLHFPLIFFICSTLKIFLYRL